ncbi:SMP-30/gluconolactonase/LRE family protein [Hymenobacter terrenus]|uniref:SMP-30/gluconolactonase/LRE family protein n=1 Tax=Hymenobacter terrenus TaxID=1629124 RepID=UPI000698163C|nr:SMP-30/gluconolactonase/LRE family protein [Hymenobacter terrenus]
MAGFGLLFGSAAHAQSIPFSSNELYPEGLAYHSADKTFFVSSIHHGRIGRVDRRGAYRPFVEDEALVSSLGLAVDDTRNRLLVCVADPGVSTRTNAATQGKLAKLAIYDLKTGKRTALVDLGGLSEGGHFANDVAVAPDGTAYVTDSFSPQVWQVTPEGKASVLVRNDQFTGEGFNLNGIVYHPAGYLLLAKSNDGKLFKLDPRHPEHLETVATPALLGADGLVLNNRNELLIIQNGTGKITRLSSADQWGTATVQATTASEKTFPTTGTWAQDHYYVLNAKLNEIFDPKAPRTSDFLIQQVPSDGQPTGRAGQSSSHGQSR